MALCVCSQELCCVLPYLAEDGDAEGSKPASVASDPVVMYMRWVKMS